MHSRSLHAYQVSVAPQNALAPEQSLTFMYHKNAAYKPCGLQLC